MADEKKCKKCGQPIVDEASCCSCDDSLCSQCCDCPDDCGCGCKQK